MTTTALSLPIDVPWKRLAISQDMYAATLDGDLPQKWRSSLAVFFYEPQPDPADTTGDVTTFLKLVVSITGYNYDGVLHYQVTKDPLTVKLYFESVYYPALCALTQIAVFPSGGQWSIEQYPYFTDFQPKQREVVETRTDTGEFVTHSTEPLKVTKSTTTTDDQETLSYEYGTRSTVSKTGTANETLFTDASRERRETTSYSSSLAQLYQLLDSYHSGTNRALFLTMARPHLVDSIYTFVNGPRRLEGVQEFFLVVRRPQEMADVCVKAVLETAHLDPTDSFGGWVGGSPAFATMFTTARAVSGCTGGGGTHILPAGPWVTYEQQLPSSVNDLLNASAQSGRPAVVAANALSRAVHDMFVASFRDGMRYPFGTVDFLNTSFAMRKLVSSIPPELLRTQPKVLDATRAVESSLAAQGGQLSKAQLAARQRLLSALRIPVQRPQTARQLRRS